MRFRVGAVPVDPRFQPDEEAWRKLKEPSFGVLILLALPVAALLVAGMLVGWAAVARASGADEGIRFSINPATMLVSLGALVALVVIHELAHVLALPRLGLTSRTVVGFWPSKLTPYVSYEGELARNRAIAAGLSPFVFLSLFPLLAGVLFAWIPAWLVALSTINALASSADLIGAALLAFQLPRRAVVRSKGLQTWWRDGMPDATRS